MTIRKILSAFAFFVFFANISCATIKIDVNKGNIDRVPIALLDFDAVTIDEKEIAIYLSEIVQNDLVRSGIFRIFDYKKFPEDVIGQNKPDFSKWHDVYAIAGAKIRIQEGYLHIDFKVWDTLTKKEIDMGSIVTHKKKVRRAAHNISDALYQSVTGEEGFFNTKIAFISEKGPKLRKIKRLAAMDQDGENIVYLSDGKDLVLTPRFANKSKKMAYLSYQEEVPKVYVMDVMTKEAELIGEFEGISFAPRFSPDDSKIIMSIADSGTTGIYQYDMQAKKMHLVHSVKGAISTSPSYSPDGKKIAFSSDAGNMPSQIYTMNADGSNVVRITPGKHSYTAPNWSPRGDYIAFTKLYNKKFHIGVIKPDGSSEKILTSSWMDESPTWSPNGRMIVFARQKQKGDYNLYSVDVMGYNVAKITTPHNASDPAWSISFMK